MPTATATGLIERLDLVPHPEGGHYRRLFTSPVMMEAVQGKRPSMTAIHYLLKAGEFSAWHRLRSSELWHWQAGGRLLVCQLDGQGGLQITALGPEAGLNLVIPPDTWFAAELAQDSDFALCTCTVSPGFDFADFELAQPERLAHMFPAHEQLIKRLGRQPRAAHAP